jgi:hypothetical protein
VIICVEENNPRWWAALGAFLGSTGNPACAASGQRRCVMNARKPWRRCLCSAGTLPLILNLGLRRRKLKRTMS